MKVSERKKYVDILVSKVASVPVKIRFDAATEKFTGKMARNVKKSWVGKFAENCKKYCGTNEKSYLYVASNAYSRF